MSYHHSPGRSLHRVVAHLVSYCGYYALVFCGGSLASIRIFTGRAAERPQSSF